jgi:hypothetical protein
MSQGQYRPRRGIRRRSAPLGRVSERLRAPAGFPDHARTSGVVADAATDATACRRTGRQRRHFGLSVSPNSGAPVHRGDDCDPPDRYRVFARCA